MLKTFWKKKFHFNWKFGFALILIFGIARFAAVLYGIESGDNKYLSLLFILMIATPVIFLTKAGGRAIGFKRPNGILNILYSLVLGGTISLLVFWIGQALYGDEISNWFRYIGESYPIDFSSLSAADKQIYFIVFLLIGMTFSPLGEEILYRGVIHGSLVPKFSEKGAAVIDSAAFGIIHLAHFGFVFYNGSWSFLVVPGLIWMLLIFCTGLLFNYCRRKTDSIFGAVVSHMGFNIVMTYLIFYKIFV